MHNYALEHLNTLLAHAKHELEEHMKSVKQLQGSIRDHEVKMVPITERIKQVTEAISQLQGVPNDAPKSKKTKSKSRSTDSSY